MEWNDFTTIYETIQHFRRILSKNNNPPIIQVIQSGAVRYFVQYLDLKQIHRYFNVEYSESLNSSSHSDDFPHDPRKKTISVSKLHELQYEASRAITNLASGASEHRKYLVDLDCIPKLIELLDCKNDNLKEQCLWALENISGESFAMRDLVLDQGFMPIVLKILENTTDVKLKRTAVWDVKNLLRNPKTLWEIASTTIVHACWAISYACDGTFERVQAIIAHEDLTRKLIELFNHDNPDIQYNIINHPKIDIRKEALWTLSNITAGTTEQIQRVIETDIIPKIISLLLSDSEPLIVAKEGYWTLANLCSSGNHDQIKYAIDQGIVRVLCNGLLLGDQQIIKVVLEGINNLVLLAQDLNILDKIKEFGGMYTIQDLKYHRMTMKFRTLVHKYLNILLR